MFGLLLASALSLAAQSVGVNVGDSAHVIVPPSAKLAVPVSVDLSSAGALNLASLQAGVTWGASQLTFDSIRVAPGSGFTLTPNPASVASGSLTLNAFSATALAASGPLFNLYFTAGASSGGTHVALTPTVAATDMAQDLLMQLAVRNVDVCVATRGLWGDVTDDGTVNIVDAQQIARFSVGLSVANPTALASRGDVTADGTVNIIDAQQIARFSVALSAAVRVNATWLSVAPVATVAVAPAGDTLVVGQAVGLAAALQDSTTASVAGCYPVTWTSSDTTVAKVSSAGLVTGMGPGTATITATSGGKNATATVTAFALGSATQVGTAGGVVQATGSDATLSLPAGALTSGSLLLALKDSIGYSGVDRPLADRAYLLSVTPIGSPTWGSGQDAVLTLPITQALAAGQAAVVSVVVAGDTMWFPAAVTTAAASAARVARPSLRSAAPSLSPGIARSAPLSPSLTSGLVAWFKLPQQALAWITSTAKGVGAGVTNWVATFGIGWMSTSDLPCDLSTYPSSKASPAWRSIAPIKGDLTHDPQQTPFSGNVQVVLVEGINPNVGDCKDFTHSGTRSEDYFENLTPVLRNGLGDAYTLWAFTYPTSNHLSRSGTALAGDLEALYSLYPLSDIVIVAHSMGGLVSRLAAGQLSSATKGKLKGIITLGTPHLGVPLANLGTVLTGDPWALGALGFKASWGMSDLYAGVPDQLTKEATLYAYAGDITARSFGSMPAALLDDGLWMLRLDACGVSYSLCHSDGIVPVSSATPAFIIHQYPSYSYDHVELRAGFLHSGSASDPLYLSVINDIKTIAPVLSAPVPGRVSDLAVSATTSSSATLSFTQVSDGAGGAANYEVRYEAGPITWATATGVANGTCATPISTGVGATLTCTVQGLVPNTAYNFQMVAFRAVFNGDAVFGGLSNVAPGTTALSGITFASISAGGDHTCALTGNGAAYCWGSNTAGQLGDGTTTNRSTPVAVQGGLTFTSVTAGKSHTCGLTGTGTAYCWGLNSLDFMQAGTVGGGQLGDGGAESWQPIPVAVQGGFVFTSLSAGSYSTCGLTSTGAAYCWGSNYRGQLGDGTQTERLAPVAVQGGLAFTGITVAFEHSCAWTNAGVAYCWGDNDSGQGGLPASGFPRLTPHAVTGDLLYAALTVGFHHTCGLTQEGTAYCWGANYDGALGGPDPLNPGQQVAVEGGLSFARLTTGGFGFHNCALAASAAAYCWGENGYGQLGDGTTTSSRLANGTISPPAEVQAGVVFTVLRAGGYHTCGLTGAGAAYCWGRNESGQLGDGTTTNRLTPALVIQP